MQPIEIQNILAELTRSIGENPIEITPIAASGSARSYFRIVTETHSVIGTYSSNVEENEAFLSFCRHFHDLGLNVPEILAENEEKTCYLQSDFGDDNLFAHVQKTLMANSGPSTGSGTLISYDDHLWALQEGFTPLGEVPMRRSPRARLRQGLPHPMLRPTAHPRRPQLLQVLLRKASRGNRLQRDAPQPRFQRLCRLRQPSPCRLLHVPRLPVA